MSLQWSPDTSRTCGKETLTTVSKITHKRMGFSSLFLDSLVQILPTGWSHNDMWQGNTHDGLTGKNKTLTLQFLIPLPR